MYELSASGLDIFEIHWVAVCIVIGEVERYSN